MNSRPLSASALALATLLFAGYSAFAPDGTGTDPEKALVPRPAQAPAGPSLQLLVSPTQDTFRLDEPIRFRVAGNDPFYLYVYSVEDNGKTATAILAPARTKDRYEKG